MKGWDETVWTCCSLRSFLHLPPGASLSNSNDKPRSSKERYALLQILSCSLSGLLPLFSAVGIYPSIALAQCDCAPLLHTWFFWARVLKNDPAHVQGEHFGKYVWSVCSWLYLCVCVILLVQRESRHCKGIECLPFGHFTWGRARMWG